MSGLEIRGPSLCRLFPSSDDVAVALAGLDAYRRPLALELSADLERTICGRRERAVSIDGVAARHRAPSVLDLPATAIVGNGEAVETVLVVGWRTLGRLGRVLAVERTGGRRTGPQHATGHSNHDCQPVTH